MKAVKTKNREFELQAISVMQLLFSFCYRRLFFFQQLYGVWRFI